MQFTGLDKMLALLELRRAERADDRGEGEATDRSSYSPPRRVRGRISEQRASTVARSLCDLKIEFLRLKTGLIQ